MKKIIYVVCGIFIMGLIIENSNFMYAENDILEDTKINKISNDDGILDNEELDDEGGFDDDEEIQIKNGEESNLINDSGDKNEILGENDNETESNNDIDGLSKLGEIQTFEVTQVYQEIDTSDYGIIRIKDPNYPGKGITIHDRNLGATATGAGITDDASSYGFYFQWGNNYGFSSNSDIITTDTRVDASSYGPNNPYSSNIFVTGYSDWSTVRNDNLRGGELDGSNNRGYPAVNPENRRGPCPEGYHVPSAGEWSKLLEFWSYIYTGSLHLSKNPSNNLNYFEGYNIALHSFYNKFYIPVAGKLSYQDSNLIETGNQMLLQSSSAKISDSGIFNVLGRNSNLYSNGAVEHRAYAVPIRCFYNSYWLPVIITYDINGGYWTDDESNEKKVIMYTKADDDSNFSGYIVSGKVKRRDTCGENGNKKCMFGGWYTSTDDTMWTGNISEDISLYAKRLEFDDKNISLSGINFTIMDRNLGAENPGTGENAYGYYLTGENDVVCPEGYHVPSTGEWIGIKELLGVDFNGDLLKDLLDLPSAGKMTNDEDIENDGVGYYLANNGNEIMYAKINNSDINIMNLNEGEKVSVRCFKDYGAGTIKFNTNGGENMTDINAVNWREDGQYLENPERDNSIFLGWYTTTNFQEGTKVEKNINYKNENEINIYAKWVCEEGFQENENKCEAIYFDITWIDGNENIIKTDSVKWGDFPSYTGSIPTKNSTNNYKYTFNGNWLPEIIAAFENTGYIAQFKEEIIRRSGGSSGGGGRGNSSKDTNVSSGMSVKDLEGNSQDSSEGKIAPTPLKEPEWPEGENSTSINDKGSKRNDADGFSQEFIDAYNFAYQNGITTKSPIKNAKLGGSLTRIQMAKMLSNYAINVLGKHPDLSKGVIKFNDVSYRLNKEYDYAVSLIYQLGIMGQNIKGNNFRPNDTVTRAEFSTALSRLLYGTEDGTGNQKYYEPHITKLYNEGIISKANPKMEEKRGYVMIMLKRYFE